MSPSSTCRVPILAAAAAVALTVGACSPSEAGAAAVVGGRRVTNDQLQQALVGLRAGNPDFAQVQGLDRLVLFDLLAGPFLTKAAQDAGLGVSPSEAQAALPKTPSANENALAALQAQIAFNKLTQAQKGEALAAVSTALKQAGVKVSPRFGRFDATSLSIVAAAPNWLPTPAPTPTATP